MKYLYNELIFKFFSNLIKNYLPSEIIYDVSENDEYEKLYLNSIHSNDKVINIDTLSKYRFLNYLVNTKPIVLHGSSKNLDLIEPRTSHKGTKCLYASKDVFHSIGYSLINTNMIFTSPIIYTGSFIFENNNNLPRPSFISIVESAFVSKGIIYILPKDTFSKTISSSRIAKLTNNRIQNTHSLSWVSYEPIKPLAKVLIDIEDLPFKISLHKEKEPYMLSIIKHKKRCNIKE